MYPYEFLCPGCVGRGCQLVPEGIPPPDPETNRCQLCHGSGRFYLTEIRRDVDNQHIGGQYHVAPGMRTTITAVAAGPGPMLKAPPFSDVEILRPGKGNIERFFETEEKLFPKKKVLKPKNGSIKRDNAEWDF